MILDYMKVKSKALIDELLVVCDFPEVFLDDIMICHGNVNLNSL